MTEPFFPPRQWPENLTRRLTTEGLSKTDFLAPDLRRLVTVTRWLHDGKWMTSFVLIQPTEPDGHNKTDIINLRLALDAAIDEATNLESARPNPKP